MFIVICWEDFNKDRKKQKLLDVYKESLQAGKRVHQPEDN